ncbi:hypothetical protein B0A55_10478 [Friedmanniomyces simplex]|uniref:Uncharacterized protein n=1 Tax=Friedmanniomyces simplex TaxID=329884 RepID=A0A4U0WGS1_9PEZI|nr:hypothetical protein B0A55_10478 [Friedmanniomyces simplex]
MTDTTKEPQPRTPTTVLPAKHLNHLRSIRILAANCCQDLRYVHCLVGNAIILARASGRELRDSAEQLHTLCAQVASACRTVGYAVGKVIEGSRTVREVLRGTQKRCEEAVADMKRAEGMLKTVFSGDQLREGVVKARVVETRQRLEDGVMWRMEELGEDGDDDISAVATGTL